MEGEPLFQTRTYQNKWPTCIRLSQISIGTFITTQSTHIPNFKLIWQGVIMQNQRAIWVLNLDFELEPSYQNKWPALGAFITTWSIHIPNVKLIRQGAIIYHPETEGDHGFKPKPIKIMAICIRLEPNIELDLHFPKIYPHIKFEVDQSRRSQVIVRKQTAEVIIIIVIITRH